jgi:FkbM family methyltransferase
MYPDTHSQYDEEQAIASYFTARAPGQKGRFLDIGAWDAKTFSNTRALYERGWRGVMIDPSPFAVAGLVREYGGDPLMQIMAVAVATEATMLRLHVSEDSVSTTKDANYDSWKTQTKFHGDIFVPSITWETINNQFGGFDFANIDAEGVSVDLFHDMLKYGAKPPCVCVEHDGRLPELGQAATAAVYKMIYANGTNAVFAL